MMLQGNEVLMPNELGNRAKAIAGETLTKGPDSWSQKQIDKECFLITDILDDIRTPKSKEKQITSAAHLFEPLLQFYFRSQKKWAANDKSLRCLFKAESPELAEEWTQVFENLAKTGDA